MRRSTRHYSATCRKSRDSLSVDGVAQIFLFRRKAWRAQSARRCSLVRLVGIDATSETDAAERYAPFISRVG
jgi:hypothetical protein